jgi:hypothetical protein
MDNVITDEECDALISQYNINLKKDLTNGHWGYEYADIYSEDKILNKIVERSFSEYKKKFPAKDRTTYRWSILPWRFKRFAPGDSFNIWHSEHTKTHPNRILACIFYLSNHNCGTEFMEPNETVLSKKGRILMFPTFWTHIHRGQVCPDNKERFIMSAYVEFVQ